MAFHPRKEHYFTKEEFEGFDPKAKGFAVYMHGARAEQPNIPETFDTSHYSPEEKALYEEGVQIAIIQVQDNP